jgi:hypothetical protein
MAFSRSFYGDPMISLAVKVSARALISSLVAWPRLIQEISAEPAAFGG